MVKLKSLSIVVKCRGVACRVFPICGTQLMENEMLKAGSVLENEENSSESERKLNEVRREPFKEALERRDRSKTRSKARIKVREDHWSSCHVV